ncbi:hypothetical protein A0H76_2621 [Hepatospora eriocheir]|uniref:Uncharacterized protein n=1 Tax=Hepatospora eriocheir TaxID=1081669 RepID=A0A1X0QJM5_9MICR|nr:hypothetical protein A0H76_2621 [Hepatospora eriocheir]
MGKQEKDKENNEIAVSKIFDLLKPFSGYKCNILVSDGIVVNNFDSKIFLELDSTKWKLFYLSIDQNDPKKEIYEPIRKNTYITETCKEICFENGVRGYLRKLEPIDVGIIGSDIKICKDKNICIVKNKSIKLTQTFIDKFVKKLCIISKSNSVIKSEETPGVIVISNEQTDIGFFQKIFKRIKKII